MLRGVSGAGVRASGGLCEKFVCKSLLKAGFGLSGSPRGLLREWVEGGRKERGEQSTESRHAVTLVRCYGAQALSR